MEFKVCTKCLFSKDLSAFSKNGKGLKSRCKKCEANRVREYVFNNYDLVKEKKKEYWRLNKHRFLEKHNEKSREYRRLHPEKRKESVNKYAKNNRHKIYAYWNNRYKNDPEFHAYIKIRRRIGVALNRINAGRRDRTIDLLGCTFAYFVSYISNKFTDGMSIDKIFSGEIHIDHIRPCSTFNLLDPKQQKICFHYTNLQPLWAADNMHKHNNESWQRIQ